MNALTFNCYIKAGLQLSGQEQDGSLQFMGTAQQWQTAGRLLAFNETWR